MLKLSFFTLFFWYIQQHFVPLVIFIYSHKGILYTLTYRNILSPFLLNKDMAKEITMERLAEAIIKTKKEVDRLKTELEKVQSYLREQHKLKKQLKSK